MNSPASQIEAAGNAAASHSSTAPKFARARALAAICGVSAKTIKRWAAKNPDAIHTFRVSSTVVLFDAAQVIRFVERGRVE